MSLEPRKRLSVIIPGYNNPDGWWRRCILSVQGNIGPDDEIVCVDDYSSSISPFLEEVTAEDRRVRVIRHVRNEGLPAARNTGLSHINGSFVTFVDSDDEIMPHTYEKCINELQSNDVDIVMFGVRSVWVNERLQREDVPHSRCIGELKPEDIAELGALSILNYAWNKVYKTDFLSANRLIFERDGVPCEDVIFVLQCIMAKAKWSCLDHIGINYYRTHSTLLSRYKPTYVQGAQRASLLWHAYKEQAVDVNGVLGKIGETSTKQIFLGQWDNIWRIGSPYGIREKWRFLKQHSEITNGYTFIFFLRKIVFQILRRYFYIRPIQRWHIKKINPTAMPF